MTTSTPPHRRFGLLLAAGAVLAGLGIAAYFALRSHPQPDDRAAALELARTAAPADALPALRRALDAHPEDPELLKAVVQALMASGALVADVEPYTARWCAASPDDPAAFRARLSTALRLNRHAEALAAGERILALAPDDTTRAIVADLYLMLGQYDGAAREFARLLDTPITGSDPAVRARVLTGLARAEWEQGKRAEAVRHLDQLLAENPTYAPALVLRGTAYYEDGEYAAAVAVLRRVKAADTRDREAALYALARSLDQLGKAAEAKQAFAELAAVQNSARFMSDAQQRPDDMGLQVRAGETLLAAGQPDEARLVLEAAVSRLGPTRPALTALARCYDQLGRADLARQTRTRADGLP